LKSDRLSIPVLLRQYLKLNAPAPRFNVDPAFAGRVGCADAGRSRESIELFLAIHGWETAAKFFAHIAERRLLLGDSDLA